MTGELTPGYSVLTSESCASGFEGETRPSALGHLTRALLVVAPSSGRFLHGDKSRRDGVESQDALARWVFADVSSRFGLGGDAQKIRRGGDGDGTGRSRNGL